MPARRRKARRRSERRAKRRRPYSEMARPEGFEPPAPRFVVWCSIQLSYGRACSCSERSARHRGPSRACATRPRLRRARRALRAKAMRKAILLHGVHAGRLLVVGRPLPFATAARGGADRSARSGRAADERPAGDAGAGRAARCAGGPGALRARPLSTAAATARTPRRQRQGAPQSEGWIAAQEALSAASRHANPSPRRWPRSTRLAPTSFRHRPGSRPTTSRRFRRRQTRSARSTAPGRTDRGDPAAARDLTSRHLPHLMIGRMLA